MNWKVSYSLCTKAVGRPTSRCIFFSLSDTECKQENRIGENEQQRGNIHVCIDVRFRIHLDDALHKSIQTKNITLAKCHGSASL